MPSSLSRACLLAPQISRYGSGSIQEVCTEYSTCSLLRVCSLSGLTEGKELASFKSLAQSVACCPVMPLADTEHLCCERPVLQHSHVGHVGAIHTLAWQALLLLKAEKLA